MTIEARLTVEGQELTHQRELRCLASEFVEKSGSNSVVESQPSKLLVAGSIPVSRSNFSIK